MKKEILLAVLIGLGLGLIITYGVYRARTSLTNPSTGSTESQVASPTPASQTSLVITAPEDEIVQSTASITVAGTTTPNSFVVVLLDDEETITTADASGNFSVERQLSLGANVILIFSVDEDGNTAEVERTVVLTEEEEADPTDETSTEEDS
jgi:hypothetical protein